MVVRRKNSKKELPRLPKKEEETKVRKFLRELKEREDKEIRDKKQKAIDDKKEYERRRKIIIPYLDNLKRQINEKELRNFWAFPDNAVFKKIKCNSIQKMQKILDKNPSHYAGRKICFITLHFEQNEDDNSLHRKGDTWFGVNIDGFNIDKNGKLIKGLQKFGGHFVWKTKDFALTKFSFKLLERIMRSMAIDNLRFPSIAGFDMDFIKKILKGMKVDTSDIFQPLAGI